MNDIYHPKDGCELKSVVLGRASSKKRQPPTPKSKSPRFFIARPGLLLGKLVGLQPWHEWEVGDHRGQDRICLTSCKRKAELIRDALEAFHATKP